MPKAKTFTFQGTEDSVSDGHHTFAELYDHRHALTLALMKAMPEKSWYSLLHDDGTMFDDSFIVGIDLPAGTVTYHLPTSLLGHAAQTGAEVKYRAPKWDGHTSSHVAERLYLFAGLRYIRV